MLLDSCNFHSNGTLVAFSRILTILRISHSHWFVAFGVASLFILASLLVLVHLIAPSFFQSLYMLPPFLSFIGLSLTFPSLSKHPVTPPHLNLDPNLSPEKKIETVFGIQHQSFLCCSIPCPSRPPSCVKISINLFYIIEIAFLVDFDLFWNSASEF